MPLRVTLDTNSLPVDDWLTPQKRDQFDFAVVSVTAEEFVGTSYIVHLVPLVQVPKHTGYGAGGYGVGPYGGVIDRDCLRRALAIISNLGEHPKPAIDGHFKTGHHESERLRR